MNGKVEYQNLLSRIFLRPWFEHQFVFPEEPSGLLPHFMRWYEARVMKPDLSGIEIDRPIFMIALPRTGGSILQNIICAHPDVSYITNPMHVHRTCFCALEHFQKRLKINARGERYLGDSVVVDIETPSDGIAFWFQWLREDPHSLEYVARTVEDFSLEEIENIKQTIRKMIYCFEERSGRFFCKNPMLVPQILLLKDLFPHAKFVHVVRDPRMVANSLLKLYRLETQQIEKIRRKKRHLLLGDKPFVPYPRLPNLARNVQKYGADDIRTTAHLWNDAITLIHRNKDALPTFHEVRHEDILADPRKEVFKILEFCELSEPGKDNTKFWQKIGEFGAIRHKNAYDGFDVVESICRDNMRRYGYL